MAEPEPRVRQGACPRCYQPVTDTMARVLTSGGSYHRRCYMRALQPRRASELGAPPARVNGAAPPRDGIPRLLERLAQIVVIVIVIGTGLILLEHALR